LALAGVVTSGLLAASNILIGWMARSTSVVATGVEFAVDVLASAAVFAGLALASKPADADHPYGHGRSETLAGLLVGLLLAVVGFGICYQSLQQVGERHDPPALYGVWPLAAAALIKGGLAGVKFRYGRRIQSSALVADAWNDAMDVLSGLAALAALGLTLYDPARFLAADHYGGFAVGLIVIVTAVLVVRDTSLQLMDTMPEEALVEQIRAVALRVPHVSGVEKCFARNSGLQYHVDLHLEVDPKITVQVSHEIASQVRAELREQLDWIADVLVHVEPAGLGQGPAEGPPAA
jgi:cation diffusion facilitator family transporter